MAYPGTYNFSYYKGDTYEFRIYPKNSDGSAFDLTAFHSSSGDKVKFNIADKAGTTDNSNRFSGTVSVVNNAYLLCTITPDTGIQLSAATKYVYDIYIRDNDAATPVQYTLLTGTITVTERIAEKV